MEFRHGDVTEGVSVSAAGCGITSRLRHGCAMSDKASEDVWRRDMRRLSIGRFALGGAAR